MTERGGPQVYSIAAHRGFADALVAGLIPRYGEDQLGLARLTLLLPSRRAERIVTEAFVRLSGQGLLLPRMAVVGDLDLDETLGPLLDPLGAGTTIPPAADPLRRQLRLAELLREAMGDGAPPMPALLRLAFDTGRTIDRLAIEGIGFERLIEERIAGIVGEQAQHWIASTRQFAVVLAHWQAELAERGEVDGPERRNRLFDHAAARWRDTPPKSPLVAAGITSASPALARLLRVVAETPRGAVILPDLDLSLDEETWDLLGTAGAPERSDDPPFGEHDALTHPQYHLKLLLNRMGVNRGEVEPWHRAGLSPAPPERSRAISNLFLPSRASARWVDLPAAQRRLSGVRLMNSAHPGEEAQAIAVLIREALEVPERRVALVTPDRKLAGRVVAHLRRWQIAADDTAGQPLSQTPAGRLVLQLSEVVATKAAPVALLALLQHPLAGGDGDRAAWLEHARHLDRRLRGPRLAPGLAPIADLIGKMDQPAQDWWTGVEATLGPLLAWPGELPLADALEALAQAGEVLCGLRLWSNADGRALSAWVEDQRAAARDVGTLIAPGDVLTVLRDAMDRVAVRPPWGSHPRVAIYGLLEARMSRADLVICAGLTEGAWPGSAAPESLLPPAVLRALGVPAGEFRIGLAAHDLAGSLGAPEVVLSWADRDEGGPVIPSRFVLRVEALLGDLAGDHRETRAVDLARAIDRASPAPPYPRPEPRPSTEQRDVPLAVTAIDRLRSDPYQFYAQAILRLRALDPLDAEPSAAWKGTAVHRVLNRWHEAGQLPGALHAIADAELRTMQAHPLVRALWWPRLARALDWIDAEVARLAADEGRSVALSEKDGAMEVDGVRVFGRADRIDRRADGKLVVVDYKTGSPPSGRMVQEGFALQLGVLGLIARDGGFAQAVGDPDGFEYWSLGKDPKNDSFGYVAEPVLEGQKKSGLPRAEFLYTIETYLREAIVRWIKGDEAFTARLNPDIGGYNDYDQLMRLDEWQTRADAWASKP
ncbi:ATP-dependent helicase/nuclease subunit B [Novosphingobium kunmingense]|uniref:ATP-dependent helicase/nuclease subunit B n=1 Tax=Novosphingobium kunmingense TaxID=1211806 RepID=A0A2N0I3B1_9SPHN|nr:PD-(D/E)XK nuclease family protein [Novosphingobium kunmingense]PKB25663.1 ATP-dependent helicase/nuclease subunit B [Novosphingobium kunmingense]